MFACFLHQLQIQEQQINNIKMCDKTYLWVGKLFEMSFINSSSIFLSYSVTKSKIEDLVLTVLVL